MTNLSQAYTAKFEELKTIKERMLATGEIEQSDGSHVSVYISAIRYLREHTGNDHACEIVLYELAAHADHLGVCWPSAQTLAGNVGYSENTVGRALQTLGELDFIRLTYYTDPRTRKQKSYYNLNPDALYIRAEIRPQARQSFEAACNLQAQIVINDVQPYITSAKNQNQEPKPRTNKQPPKTEKPKTHEKAPLTNSPTGQKAQGDSPTAIQGDSPTAIQGDSPKSEKIASVPSRAALPAAADEAAAQAIKALDSRIAIATARKLVTRYGRGVARTAADCHSARHLYANWIGVLMAGLERATLDAYPVADYDQQLEKSAWYNSLIER